MQIFKVKRNDSQSRPIRRFGLSQPVGKALCACLAATGLLPLSASSRSQGNPASEIPFPNFTGVSSERLATAPLPWRASRETRWWLTSAPLREESGKPRMAERIGNRFLTGKTRRRLAPWAVAPSEHNILWAGTGETWLIRPEYPMGDGVYKSTDAGATWRHIGLDLTGQIGRIVIDPHYPNRVFVCAPGQLFRPHHERGIFRTLDGGRTWEQALSVNPDTGSNDLAMDPQYPNTLFAGMWQVEIHTWDLASGGPGGGICVTHDGGATWSKLAGHGLPAADRPVGKIEVAIPPSDSRRMYALMQDTQPALDRSDDGGRWGPPRLTTSSAVRGSRRAPTRCG